MNRVGILVYGRDIRMDTEQWEKLVWGQPPYKLGSLPMLVLTILNEGIDNIRLILLGSGVARKDNMTIAQYTKRYLINMYAKLKEFDLISCHPDFQLRNADLFMLLKKIQCVNESANTQEETINAAAIFTASGVQKVVQISCGSHIARCIMARLIAKEDGYIPAGQIWTALPDDMLVSNSARDVVIVEPPHRVDDPMLNTSPQLHQLLPRFFRLPAEAQIYITQQLGRLLDEFK